MTSVPKTWSKFRLWCFTLVAVLAAEGFSPHLVFGSPPHLIRERVGAIVDTFDFQSAQADGFVFLIKAIFNQNAGDRQVALDELVRLARGLQSGAEAEALRGEKAYRILHATGYSWSGLDGIKILLSFLRRTNYSSMDVWARLFHIANGNQRFKSLILARLYEVPEGERFVAEDTFIKGLAVYYHTPRADLEQWGPLLAAHPWSTDSGSLVMESADLDALVFESSLLEHVNGVRWVREAFLRRHARGYFYGDDMRQLIQKLGNTRQLHPEIESALLSQPKDIFHLFPHLMYASPRIRDFYLAELRRDPDAFVDILTAELNNKRTKLRPPEAALARYILPELEAQGRYNLVAKILKLTADRYQGSKETFSPELSAYVLGHFARNISRNSGGDGTHLNVALIMHAVARLPDMVDVGYSRPEVQAAIINIYNAPYLRNQFPYDRLISSLNRAIPASAYTPETRAFILEDVRNRKFLNFFPAFRRLVHYDRNIRDELVEILRTETPSSLNYTYALDTLTDFYHTIPEVRAGVDAGHGKWWGDNTADWHNRTRDWVRRRGIPSGVLYDRYIGSQSHMTVPSSLLERTNDVELLLAGPTPVRSVHSGMALFITPDLDVAQSLGVGNIVREQEEPLLRLRGQDGSLGDLAQVVLSTVKQPGLPSLTTLFDHSKITDRTASEIYNAINWGTTLFGADRIRNMRIGHLRRNRLLDEAVQSRGESFLLDPMTRLQHDYLRLQARQRNPAQNVSETGEKVTSNEAMLPPLSPREQTVIDVQARAQILETISQSHPLTEVVLSTRSIAPYGVSASPLPENLPQVAPLSLPGIPSRTPDFIQKNSVTLSPERFLNQPPYNQDYHRLVTHLTHDARVRKANALRLPPAQELALWRRRQLDVLRNRFRGAFATMISEGHGSLAYIPDPNYRGVLPEGFDVQGRRIGKDVHILDVADLNRINFEWDSLTNEPVLLLSGQRVPVSTLQYLPHLPPEMNPDAVSTYFMTEPDARGPRGEILTEQDLVRETLFRRSVPHLIQNYAEGVRVLDAQFTADSDMEFQLGHFVRQHEQTQPLRWLPNDINKAAVALEAHLWSEGMDSVLERERSLRRNNLPAENLVERIDRANHGGFLMPTAQNNNNLEAPPTSATATPQPVALPLGARSTATNHIPKDDIHYHVAYRGRIPREQMPAHFLLGQVEDFRNASESHVVNVPPPPARNPVAWLLRGRNRNYPALVEVRTRVPMLGGPHAPDAPLPRPENHVLSHIEVTDLQGRRLKQGKDYDVLMHGPTRENIVRLRREVGGQVPFFHINAAYRISATPDAANPLSQTYEIERLRPVIMRLRDAGFVVLADRLDALMRSHSERNSILVVGSELEATVRESGLYTYRSEQTFPAHPSTKLENEFTPLARFLAEDAVVCTQCSGASEIFSAVLESYHGGNPSVRVESRSEFWVEPGARTLRADDFHARTHELRRSPAGEIRRTIYDSTPNRRDPRSPVPAVAQSRGAGLRRGFQTTQSHIQEWWRRARNAAMRAREFIARRRIQNASPNFATATATNTTKSVDSAPLTYALPPLRDYLALGLTEAPVAASSPTEPSQSITENLAHEPTTIPFLGNPLGLESSVLNERNEAIAREHSQLRRIIQSVGGHQSLDPREALMLADRLIRTYQRLNQNQISVGEAVTHLNSIHSELNLEVSPSPSQLRQAFSTTAAHVISKTQAARGFTERSFAHYRGPQGTELQTTLTNLLTPLIETPTSAEGLNCITKSLQGLR